jgi:hypothetical protein
LSLALVATLPFIALSARSLRQGISAVLGDYAQYLLHAAALLHGKPYTDTGYLFSPYNGIGPIAYPPGTSLLLLPVFSLTGVSLRVSQYVAVAWSALALVIGFSLLNRFVGRKYAIGAAAVLGVSLVYTVPLSDALFAAAIWGLIVLTDGVDRPWSMSRVLAISALGAAAILLRTSGLALIPAMAGYAVLHRRRLGIKPFVPAAVWSVAFLALSRVLPILGSYTADVKQGQTSFVGRVAGNIVTYRDALETALLFPAPWPMVNHVYHAAMFACLIVGVLRLFKAWWNSFTALVLFFYGGLLLSYWYSVSRYALPLFPIALVACGVGADALLALTPLTKRGRHATLIALCVIVTGMSTVRQLREPAPLTFEATDSQQLFDWIERCASSGHVMFVNPRVLVLRTGVPAMPPLNASDSVIAGEMNRLGITHVILGTPYADAAIESMRAYVSRHRADFRLSFRSGTYEVDERIAARGAPSTSPACTVPGA